MFQGTFTLQVYENCLKNGICKLHSSQLLPNEDAMDKKELLRKALLYIRVRILDPLLFDRPAFCDKTHVLMQKSNSFHYRHTEKDLPDDAYNHVIILDSVVVFTLCHLSKLCCLGAVFMSSKNTSSYDPEIRLLQKLLYVDHFEESDITQLDPILKENFPHCNLELVKVCFISTLLIVKRKILHMKIETAIREAENILSSWDLELDKSKVEAAMAKSDYTETVSFYASRLKKHPYFAELYMERALVYALKLKKFKAAQLDFHTFLIFNPSCLTLSDFCNKLKSVKLHKELIEISSFALASCSSDVCVLCKSMGELRKESEQSLRKKGLCNGLSAMKSIKNERKRLPKSIGNVPDLIEASDSDDESEHESTAEREKKNENEPELQAESHNKPRIDPALPEVKSESKVKQIPESVPDLIQASDSEETDSESLEIPISSVSPVKQLKEFSNCTVNQFGDSSSSSLEKLQDSSSSPLKLLKECSNNLDKHLRESTNNLVDQLRESSNSPVEPSTESTSSLSEQLRESSSSPIEEGMRESSMTKSEASSKINANKSITNKKKRTRTASGGMPSVFDDEGWIDSDVIDQYLKELSEALMENCSQKALSLLCGPLREVVQNPQAYLFSEDVAVCIKYCHGLAFRLAGGYDDLQKCIMIFKYIIEIHKSVTFPAAYYALGLTYRKLNRFKDALEYLKSVKNFLDKGIHFNCYCYPYYYTPGPLMVETSPKMLKSLVDDLIKECENPPNPDAYCRYPECSLLPTIYYSDPGFKGYTILVCSEQCCLQYHTRCWKLMRMEKEWTDKEFLERPCITPDCDGVTIKIQFIDKKGDVHKEFITDLKKEPKTKWAKWDKKAETKEKEKKKKQRTSRSESLENTNESEKVLSRKNSDVNESSISSLELSVAAKLNHEKKIPKNGIIPEKRKDVFSVTNSYEVSKGRNEPNSSINCVAKEHPIPRVEASESATNSDFLVSRSIQNNVYSYMADFLQLHGPLKTDDILLINEMSSFPDDVSIMIADSGGIGEFLKNDMRFAFVGDVYVCVVGDLASTYKMFSNSSLSSNMKDLDTFEMPHYPKYSQCNGDEYGIQSFGLNPDAVEYRPAALNNKNGDFNNAVSHNISRFSAFSTNSDPNTTSISELDNFGSSENILCSNISNSKSESYSSVTRKKLFSDNKPKQNTSDLKSIPVSNSFMQCIENDKHKMKVKNLREHLLDMLNEYFSDSVQKYRDEIDSYIKPYIVKKSQDTEIESEKEVKNKLKIENEVLTEQKSLLQKQLSSTQQQNHKLSEEVLKLQKKNKDISLQTETLEKEYLQKEEHLQNGRKFLLDSLTIAHETIDKQKKEIEFLKTQKNSLNKDIEDLKMSFEAAEEKNKTSIANQDKKQISAMQSLQQENLALKCKLQQADLRILYLKKTEFVKKIEEKTSEATQRRKELIDGLSIMCGNLNPVFETSVKTLSAQLLTYINELATIKLDVMVKIDEQLEEIKKGSSLSELKEIKMNELPPIPSWNNSLPASSAGFDKFMMGSNQIPFNLSANIGNPVTATILPAAAAVPSVIPPVGAALPKVTTVKAVPSMSAALDINGKKTIDKNAEPLDILKYDHNLQESYKTAMASINSFASAPLSSSAHSLDEDIEKNFTIFKPSTFSSTSKLSASKVPPGIQTSIELPLAKLKSTVSSTEIFCPRPLGGVDNFPKVAEELEKKNSNSSKNSYEKLISKLHEQYSSYTQEELISYVKEFREQRQEKLSGLPIDTIIKQIGTLINTKKRTSECRSQTLSNKVLVNKKLVVDPKPKEAEQQQHTKRKCAWSVDSDGNKQWSGSNKETCSICLEDYEITKSYQIQCGHIFHENCIRNWLKTNSNCPQCRHLVLLPEDYPPLV